MDGYTAIQRGATIMRRYNNPNQWVDGASVHTTFRGHMVVRVDEVQPGPTNPEMAALANVASIMAWARDVSLLPGNAEIRIMTFADYSYVVVPKQNWQRVQQKLSAL